MSERPSPGSLAALVVLGLAVTVVSVVLAAELRVVQAGGLGLCGVQGASCASLWQSPLATAVSAQTGLSVAAWGIAWGALALGFPLVALWKRAEGRATPEAITGTRLLGAAGACAVVGLMAAAALARSFCPLCTAVHVLTAGYAGIALSGWSGLGFRHLPRAASATVAALAVALVLLRVSGVGAVASSATAAGREAITAAPAPPAGSDPIREFLATLSPPMLQTLSDSLAIHRRATARALPPPRSLAGSAQAPVRITEFTDIRCSHCADLQETMEVLKSNLPPGSFSVEKRQFPLDRGCNPTMQGESDPVRCLAARALICVEGRADADEVTRALFKEQQSLTEARLRQIVGRGKDLDACLAGKGTAAALAADIALAQEFAIEGTPLVLVNGRQGTSFGPFLYAMVLAGGDPDHPAFASLPPPDPQAHLH